MTTVELCAIWLNLAADPSDYMSFDRPATMAPTTDMDVSVRTLANGRRRVVRRAGVARSYALTLPYCNRAQIEWLEDHVGQTVCVRDDRGRKMFGVYSSVPVTESTLWNDRGDAQLTVAGITYSEAV